jgi:reverse transcriptase-like protein
VLSARDGEAWHALAGRVARLVQRRLRAEVLGNRALGGGAGWSLEPVGPALRRARGAVRQLTSAPLMVRTDVARFYASVTPAVAADALGRLGAARRDAFLAAAMLDAWGSDGWSGLPVGPPGSAVLANAILLPVDEAVAGFRFLRWVDDYLIGVRTGRTALEVLDRLDEALARQGLVRSGPKTVVTGRGDPRWLRRGISGRG